MSNDDSASLQPGVSVQPLRDYQRRAVAGVVSAWETGSRRVCLVAPTGAGKTRLGEELVYYARIAGERVLFIVHRRELLRQTADRLRARFGHTEVGIIAPGEELDIDAPIQVAMVQTLLARDTRPEASLFVLDEAHHYVADDWRTLADSYPLARAVGLTATPERQDGRPLGDMFDALVVAAQYSELIKSGHLVQCAVYQPPEALADGLAQDPLIAYQRYAESSLCFAFCSSVEGAYDLAQQFRLSGISAGTIEGKTPKQERDDLLADFAAQRIRVLTSVYALTEGVDVPAARTVILAGRVSHVGGYLQRVGRVLRPHASKPHAILIDLVGATHLHGMPTEDRIYRLEGKGIERTSIAPIRQCPECGATFAGAPSECPECGFEFPRNELKQPRIYDMELKAVFAGADTPQDAQMRELNRLLRVAKEKGFHIYFAVKAFKELFGRDPAEELSRLPLEEKRFWFEKMKDAGLAKGRSINQIRGLYKSVFGTWPDWSWR